MILIILFLQNMLLKKKKKGKKNLHEQMKKYIYIFRKINKYLEIVI